MKGTVSFKKKCNIEETIKMTSCVLDICKELNIEVWLAWGALLGIIREKRLLPWNNDVELMVIAKKNYHQKAVSLAKRLKNKNYHCIYYRNISALSIRSLTEDVNVNINFAKEGKEDISRPHETAAGDCKDSPKIAQIFWKIAIIFNSYCSLNMKVFQKISIKYKFKYLLIFLINPIPLFMKIQLSKFFHLISASFGGKSSSTCLPKDIILPLKNIEFYGRKELGPNSPKKFLKYVYGEDWLIPKENWSFYSKKNKKFSYMKYKNINLFGSDLSLK